MIVFEYKREVISVPKSNYEIEFDKALHKFGLQGWELIQRPVYDDVDQLCDMCKFHCIFKKSRELNSNDPCPECGGEFIYQDNHWFCKQCNYEL